MALGFLRIPLMVTSHDVLRAHPLQEPLGLPTKLALMGALRRADVVQSVSHDAQENLVRSLPVLKKHPRLITIVNGVEVPGATCVPLASRYDTSPVSFAFVGRLMPQKGFVDIVTAVELVRREIGLRVTVYGDGGYVREYRSSIQERGLSEHFVFSGFRADVRSALAHHDAQLMPSLWEACPLAAMEALVEGCPLVASSCIGLREVSAQTPAIRVSPGHPEELADAMLQVARTRLQLKEAALAFVPVARARFDIAHSAASIEWVIRELAQRKGED